MKPELLEYLVRHCVREVLAQTKTDKKTQPTQLSQGMTKDEAIEFLKAKGYSDEKINKLVGKVNGVDEVEDPTKGAPAPPEAGQGTADQPEIPKDKPDEPLQDEPTPPPSPELKGVVFVNPKDKAKLQKVQVQGQDDASLERSLHQQAARIAGSRVKISISTSRMVKDALRNPNTAVYLYLGKYDPNSEEIFLMADKSLQVAKDSSIPSSEMTGAPVSSLAPSDFHPQTAGAGEFAQRMTAQAQGTPRRGIDEKLVKMIRRSINEVLDRK